MKKNLLFIVTLFAFLICSFAEPTTLLAFDWSEQGITVKDRSSTEEGTRISLEDANQNAFFVIYGKDLLTDPVKEQVAAMFNQIIGAYNLPTSSIEFRIRPTLFEANLVLSETGQIIRLTHHGLKPPENLIPTISAMINEFSTWNNLQIENLQVVVQENRFQTIVSAEGAPIIHLQFASAQPRQKIVAELAALFNTVSSWKGLTPQEMKLSVGKSSLNLSLKGQDAKSVALTYHGSKLGANQLKKINNAYNTVAGWNNIGFKQILFSAKPQELNSIVTLAKASYKGKNLLTHLPSGIRLVYEKKLGYNFRTVSGKYFAQVKGDYTDENKLLWQINEAVKDPLLYIQKYDPEFFFRQLEGIRNQNAEIFNDLKNKHEELLQRHNNLKQAHETFIYGFITMENSGFMGTSQINRTAISRIVELKSSNADLDRKQLEKQLKDEQYNVSNKVIDMVLNLYFNDFK